MLKLVPMQAHATVYWNVSQCNSEYNEILSVTTSGAIVGFNSVFAVESTTVMVAQQFETLINIHSVLGLTHYK